MLPKLSYNNKVTCKIFDFETCNLNLVEGYNLPWQLAYADYRGKKTLKTVERYILWPNLKLSKDAERITKFSYPKYYDLAVPAKEVAEEFAAEVYETDHLLVGHNILAFDIFILKNFLNHFGLWRGWSFIDRAIDTLALSRAFNIQDKVDHNSFLGWQMRYMGKPPHGTKKATLSAMAKSLGIPYDEAKLHDALYDIQLNYLVFDQLKYKLEL